jgi:hypothetical protein
MARLELLSKSQQIKFDSCPKLKKSQMEGYFSLSDDIQDYLSGMRKPINKGHGSKSVNIALHFA